MCDSLFLCCALAPGPGYPQATGLIRASDVASRRDLAGADRCVPLRPEMLLSVPQRILEMTRPRAFESQTGTESYNSLAIPTLSAGATATSDWSKNHMEPKEIRAIATLRAVVGYLGERDQAGWWQSAFFAPNSTAFLSPVFPRTRILAQCTGVTRAAAAVHDERIGVGRVYHLFRLPEDLEQRLHAMLQTEQLVAEAESLTAGRDTALRFLQDHGRSSGAAGAGPVSAGGLSDLRTTDGWRTAIGHYARGFNQRTEIFPYFADRS